MPKYRKFTQEYRDEAVLMVSGLSISLPSAHVCQLEITPRCEQRAKVGPRAAARGCPAWNVGP